MSEHGAFVRNSSRHGYRATFGLSSGVLAIGALLAFLASGGKVRAAAALTMIPCRAYSSTMVLSEGG